MQIDDAPLKIERFEDMVLRERFVDRLDPNTHKLASILAEYYLPHDVECALTDCRTPHRHGLLVLTADGIETNIGCDCGAREFPDQYDALRKSFVVRRARAAHMDVIAEYQSRAPTYSTEIEAIWSEPRGGAWADRCRREYMSLCPLRIRGRVSDLARRGDWRIMVLVAIKENDENDVGLGYRRAQRYEEKPLGVLRGGAALFKSVASVLRSIRGTMGTYASLDPSTMTAPARRKWAEWSRSIPTQLHEARTLVSLAREMYQTANLEQLDAFASGKRERRELRAFIRAIEQTETMSDKQAG